MMTFKQYLAEHDQLQERLIRKGAVAAYAAQGKRHGDQSVRSYNSAKQRLRATDSAKSTDAKVDALTRAFIDLLDGLVSQRQQIGSVSAQVTALSVL